MRSLIYSLGVAVVLSSVMLMTGCTVKAVGDPNRPITINANITIDIKGLKETATSIEDYVAGDATASDLKVKGGVK